MQGEKLEGIPVDFSDGDVDAFPPKPGTQGALFLALGATVTTGMDGKTHSRARSHT